MNIIKRLYDKLFNKFTIKFIIPVEYKLFSVTPLTFALGVLSQANLKEFTVKKRGEDYIDIYIAGLNKNTAIRIAKEFVFAKAMIIQQILNTDVDMDQLGAITCVINEDTVSKEVCIFFCKTEEVIKSNPTTLQRLCINRGVFEEDELC